MSSKLDDYSLQVREGGGSFHLSFAPVNKLFLKTPSLYQVYIHIIVYTNNTTTKVSNVVYILSEREHIIKQCNNSERVTITSH